MKTPAFPLDWCRAQFPAFDRQVNGQPAAFFDGPGGSQCPQRVIEAVSSYLAKTNANVGGLFATSVESDYQLKSAHTAAAAFLDAKPEEVVFGANMTTLTFALSRALAREWSPGDEILVTRLDHDGNVTPWVLAARDAGATVKHVSFRPEDCTLDMEDFTAKLSDRTRLVAVGCASNLLGTINPVEEIVRLAHQAGAEVFLDAVHYAPHGLPQLHKWNCDWAACSAYKFFGPHVGLLWGRAERLRELAPYKLRVCTNELPGRWMTGTQNHEGIAGVAAAIEYLADLGRQVDFPEKLRSVPGIADKAGTQRQITWHEELRSALRIAYSSIGRHEQRLARYFLEGLEKLSPIRVLGITKLDQLHLRTPTFALLHNVLSPHQLAKNLGHQGLFVGHGNFYALDASESLNLEPEGVIRVGLLHYNSTDEIDRLLAALAQ